MKKLRVLHVINTVGPGGAETVLYRLVSGGSEIEHEVVSLTTREWYSAPLEQRGIRLHHLNMTSAASALVGVLRLNRIIKRSRADVVQCWMYRSNVMAGVLGRLAGKRVVWGIHCSSPKTLRPTSRWLARIGGLLVRWVPDVVINCSLRSAAAHAQIGYDAAPGRIVHNGYDPEAFFPDSASRASARKLLGVPEDVFLLGSITRWHPDKNVPGFLRSVRIAKDRGLQVYGIVLGQEMDSENPLLVGEIERSGCADLVTALGRRQDVADLARAMDLHVLSSVTEAFPNVVAETMLSGTPNVVTDVGDSALMVGDTGWVVPPREPEQLAAALLNAYREWKDDPERWQERRAASRERIVENFTFDEMADAYEEVWRRCASGHSLPTAGRLVGTDSSVVPR